MEVSLTRFSRDGVIPIKEGRVEKVPQLHKNGGGGGGCPSLQASTSSVRNSLRFFQIGGVVTVTPLM